MKRIMVVLLFTLFAPGIQAQNVGIGIASPQNKLQVAGNIMATESYVSTTKAPTAAQTFNIINSSDYNIPGTDSTARIYDPGGPSGNYPPNLSGSVLLAGAGPQNTGTEVIIESINLGTGDSLIFKQDRLTDIVLLAIGNGYNTPGRYVFQGTNLLLIFKSNGDASVGSGFSVLAKRLYKDNNVSPELSGFTGNSFFFDTKTGALRAGMVRNNERGDYSIAMGSYALATSNNSIAIGSFARASGDNAVAFAQGNASGNNSTAFANSVASGSSGTAFGYGRAGGVVATAFGRGEATGSEAVAFGNNTLASGSNSTAIGNATTASGSNSLAAGAFNIAAGSSSTALGQSSVANSIASTVIGYGLINNAYSGTVVGMYNNPFTGTSQTAVTGSTHLFSIGNGDNLLSTSNAMVVRKDGRVGIGTDLPFTRLHIDGGTDANLSSTISGQMVIGDVLGSNLVFDNNEIMARNSGASTTLYLQYEGGAFEIGGTAAKPGGGSWSASSDARLKQHVQDYKDGLQQILKINPVEFNYNNLSGYDTSKQYIGVLAQELKEVAPYMVDTFKKDNTDYLKVDNTAMTYMLINAVKEQQKEMDKLKAGMKEQQKEMEELKAQLKELLKR